MEEKITSKQLLNQLLSNHYKEAAQAKAEGKPVVWATSIIPQELTETMDLTVVYPENHAAAIGARKEAPKFIAHAESNGYSIDTCSYARVNLGYADILQSEAENMPAPDLIYCGSNICCAVIKWYENLAKKFNIPMIFIDVPVNNNYNVVEENVRYVRKQLDSAIKQLEGFTKKKFDYDRLKEVMKISNETSIWWKKATDLLAAKPAPTNGFAMFNYMAPIVCFRGKEEGTRLFKMWHEELKEKVENHVGPWHDQEEKYRILWDGIACWPHLSSTYRVLKNSGVNVVTSTYPESWTLLYEAGNLDEMARAYGGLYVLRSIDYVTDRLSSLATTFGVDGVVFHSNRSCKGMDFKQFEIARRLDERFDIKSVFFDGDQTDPSVFSLAQYETRVQALIEMIEQNRNTGEVTKN